LGPLIPYIEVPELPLSFLLHVPGLGQLFDPAHPPSIKPFGTLVAFGVYLGSVVAMRHGRERGIPDKKLSEFIFFVIGLGFVGGHVLDAIFYHPDTVAKRPLYLFMLWDGLSSYGGFTGSALAAVYWRWRRKERVLPMVEVINSAFPLAWVFGRMGCATVHDHPGHASNAWLAVQWKATAPPYLPPGFDGRFDLGLIEMVLAIPLAAAFLILWRRKPVRPLGFYTGWMCAAYAPVRFFLDFLREPDATGGDVRYGGLTPAQWACFGLLAIGLYFVRSGGRGGEAGAPAPEGADAGAEEEEAGADDGEASREDEAPAKPKRRARRKRSQAVGSGAGRDAAESAAGAGSGAPPREPEGGET
jgi:phosphatidylglycerol:prolipoprotein diacylglycerol transferase